MAEREIRPACHRFFVPLAIPQPAMVAPGIPKKNLAGQIEMEVRPQVANSECLGAGCMMWNAGRSECFDRTQARALERIAENYVVPHGDQ